ncbi:hypothetical protein M231_07075 [Tremella mesenterica]|uniref:Choline kinase n=1 Tax=Tremella mesenterica TaxID=5217 RepID=A0A4Q1BEM4_TREME|nr:hypothetical protein M231_07075 [Tremella mesenterica]
MVLTPLVSPTDSYLSQSSPLSRPARTSTSSRPSLDVHPPPLRKASTSSLSKLSDFHLDSPASDDSGDAFSSEALSYQRVEGVRHIPLSLKASGWRRPDFKTEILTILRGLHVPLWTSSILTPSSIHLQKISGALTNAVYFVSFNPAPTPTSPSMSPMLTPSMPPVDPSHPTPLQPDQYPPTLLLRIYGPSTDVLISRTDELRILHVLSTVYSLGPRIYGTFTNGRVEQFFPSRALTLKEVHDPVISRGIARRMRELHSVDLHLLGYGQGREGIPMVWSCLEQWLGPAQSVLMTLAKKDAVWSRWVEEFDLPRAKVELEQYRQRLLQEGSSLVFSHNDAHCGNLLRLDVVPPNLPDHHRYVVIDFEYAAPNPRGYDIGNYFHEWCAVHHHHTMTPSAQPRLPYPNASDRENFYRAYLSLDMNASSGDEVLGRRGDVSATRVQALEREVLMWSPACSVFWSVWAIVQAEGQVNALIEGREEEVDYNYLSYAKERMGMFRQETSALGILA